MKEALEGCLRVAEAWYLDAKDAEDTADQDAARMEINRIKAALALAKGEQ